MTAAVLHFVPVSDLPNRIRELRKARGWTLERLADKLNCGITMISDLERGERELTYHWMKRLARAFKVQPADLLLPADNSQSLSAEEHELVALYQQGDEGQRRQLLGMARLLVGPPTAKAKAA